MKSPMTLNKQTFAMLYLHIVANYVKDYKYDAFYDIRFLAQMEEKRKSNNFYLFFRQMGCDRYEIEIMLKGGENLYDSYLKHNTICLLVNYEPSSDNNGNDDKYKIALIKDSDHFLEFYGQRIFNEYNEEFVEMVSGLVR